MNRTLNEINAAGTALVLVDLQQGLLRHDGGPRTTSDVVERASRLLEAFRRAGGFVVHVRVRYGPNQMDAPGRDVKQPLPIRDMPEDWHDFDPRLTPLRAEPIIEKKNWGAFHDTGLDLQLRRRGVETVVLAGIATNFAVEGTAREAHALSYSVVIVEDACTSLSAELHNFSIEHVLPKLALIQTTNEIVHRMRVTELESNADTLLR